MDYNAAALEMHAKYPGKLTVNRLFEVKDRDALSTAYTPGVAEPCRQIKERRRPGAGYHQPAAGRGP